MAVCIVGMHRSGTSMVARALQLAGLYLGRPDEMLDVAPDNPSGFWEHRRLVALNEELLNEHDAAWDCPPTNPDWASERLAFWRARGRALVDEFDSESPLWGWKDPRTSVALPFWQSLVPDLKVVVAVRNPLEVASSLRRRNRSSYQLGLALWLRYNESILSSTTPEDRLVIHYEALLTDREKELRALAEHIGLRPSDGELSQASASMSAGQRHQRSTSQQLVDAAVAPDILELYARLCEEAGWSGAPDARAASVHARLRDRLPPADRGPTRVLAPGNPPAPASGLQRAVVEPAALGRDLIELRRQAGEQSRLVTELVLRSEQSRAALVAEMGALSARIAALHEHREETLAKIAAAADAMIEHAKRSAAAGRENGDSASAARILRLERAVAEVRRLDEISWAISYAAVVERVRRLVAEKVPEGARVVVVSHGDEELVRLAGVQASHFPQADDGVHSGQHPAGSREAIDELQALERRGAEFIVFPATSMWWLDFYEGLREYLESEGELVVTSNDTGCIYALPSR